jgi:hypothetical protein
MYRHNGGVRGTKLTSGGILNSSRPRGRYNGSIIGPDLLDTDIENNTTLSGIWNMHGIKFVDDLEVTTTVDNSYYEQQPSEQRFQETGRTRLGGGYQWNPHPKAQCPGDMWPNGDYGGHSAAGYNNISRSWTTIGQASNCSNWIFDVYGISGYYYTYYPPDIYIEQIDTVIEYFDVWDFF